MCSDTYSLAHLRHAVVSYISRRGMGMRYIFDRPVTLETLVDIFTTDVRDQTIDLDHVSRSSRVSGRLNRLWWSFSLECSAVRPARYVLGSQCCQGSRCQSTGRQSCPQALESVSNLSMTQRSGEIRKTNVFISILMSFHGSTFPCCFRVHGVAKVSRSLSMLLWASFRRRESWRAH